MKIAWLHSDCLTANWLPPEARAAFVFDDAQIAAAGWGIKRLAFIFETLLELPVEIHRGPLVSTLASLGEPIVTVDTPDPWLRARIAELRQVVPVELLPAPVFVDIPGPLDLQRFSRYWRKAEGELLA